MGLEQNVEELIKRIDYLTTEIKELKNSYKPKEPTELLTRAETSELLKVNLTTLWSYTKQGKLTSYGIGNRVYYKRAEVMEAIVSVVPVRKPTIKNNYAHY